MTPEQLKALMQKLGLTAKSLGELLGVSPRTVEDWRQGRRKIRGPAVVMLQQLAQKGISSSLPVPP